MQLYFFLYLKNWGSIVVGVLLFLEFYRLHTFKVSLSLVEYGVKNFWKCLICKNPAMKVKFFSFAGGRIHTIMVV